MNKTVLKEGLKVAFENFATAIVKHAHINKKRADGGWTVGEITNHVLKSTKANFGITKTTSRPYDRFAADIKALFLNFDIKLSAMPELLPSPCQYTIEALLSELNKNKASVIRLIECDDLTESCVEIELPVWGNLTKYEWMVLYESHIIRHTKQVHDFNNPPSL